MVQALLRIERSEIIACFLFLEIYVAVTQLSSIRKLRSVSLLKVEPVRRQNSYLEHSYKEIFLVFCF